MSAQDLDPTEDFKRAIAQALGSQSVAGRVAATREVFDAWGEAIPLVAEVGISLSATGSMPFGTNLPPGPATQPPKSLDLPWTVDAVLGVNNVFRCRLGSCVQGGNPLALQTGGYLNWIQSASPSTTEGDGNLTIVKVIRAVAIIDILDEYYRSQIRDLYSPETLFSFSSRIGPTVGTSFGHPASLRTIRSVRVRSTNEYVEGILVTYENNVTSGPHGKCQGTEFSDFQLGQGFRLVKSTGQMSPHFGNSKSDQEADPPHLLRSNTGALTGLVGAYDPTGITQLQAVWRNGIEIKNYWPTRTSFAGSWPGRIFNDLEYIGDPYTARISRITLRDGGLGPIANFQTAYTWSGSLGIVEAETSVRGVDGAGHRRVAFELDKDEYIVQVTGTHCAVGMRQIQFKTNSSGFIIPALGTDGDFCRIVSNRTSAVVLDCDYAKAPKWPFPAAPDDVKDIISHVLDNQGGYYDTFKLAVGGFSAGAALALSAVSTQPKGTVKGIIAFYPPADFSLNHTDRPQPEAPKDEQNPLSTLSFIKLVNDCYCPLGTDFSDPRLSPVNVPLSCFPKHVFIAVCGYDPLRDEAIALAEKLKQGGIDVVLQDLAGVVHAWDKEAKERTHGGMARHNSYEAAVEMLKLVFDD
ncbi:hypothetical protein FRC07_001818 [Ceratobasidium sp. 392]|nr:hypothetical protein FRC07_001818 [Ceratobasidium sp. 392]